MILTKEIKTASWHGLLLLAGIAVLPGCSKRESIPMGAIPVPAHAASGLTQPAENPQIAVLSNQLVQARQAQEASSATVQKLLERIEKLERLEAEQQSIIQARTRDYEAQIKGHQDRNQLVSGRLADLETKVGSLQAGRVLPEIKVAASEGPTTAELDQKIRIVERNNELAQEAAAAKAKESPRITAGASGFSLSSADTNFVIRLRGLVQLDSRTFFDDDPLARGNDSFLLRRARPIIEGTLFRSFEYQLVSDFGGNSVQIFDAWLNYRNRPEFQIKAGKFKGPVGFENLQADASTPFNERSLVTDLVPNRSIGVQLWGEAFEGAVGYAAGVFNGSGDSRNPASSDFGDDKEFAGRLSLDPFKSSDNKFLNGLSFGAGGSYSQVSSNSAALPGTGGGTAPGYTTTAAQQFFAYNPVVGPVVADGDHWRISPYLAYRLGPFGVLGEYAVSSQGVYNSSNFRRAELEHTAWQVSAQWVLTGEPASFTGINPTRPFGLSSPGWGAWQVVARFGELDLDDRTFPSFSNPRTSASAATSWSVGLNWWLNRNLRVLTSYGRTTFEGGGVSYNIADPTTQVAPAITTRQPESVLSTRLQLSF